MDNICTICYKENNNDSISLDCNHIYHYDCIIQWFNYNRNKKKLLKNRKCPYCLKHTSYLPLKGKYYKDIHGFNHSEPEPESTSPIKESPSKESSSKV